MTKNKSQTEYKELIKNQFKTLKSEVGDYRPEAFDHLERRFFELYDYKHKCIIGFKKWTRKMIKNGENPAKDWLKIHFYPITVNEKKCLQFLYLLTESSAKKYVDLLHNYFFMIKNSESFQKKCKRLRKQGFNSLAIWLEKHKFYPVFKEA